ncbi:DeoR family sugar metabolism transcriptional regulator [Corynebacterium suranareeae]|uniref:DeoR family sugar metabolism transcriptional regulator n=1 Tax=Corynebacterium suranareeae TaxID=2506452 RepID=A0A160PMF6_9CORY|nr:DeoR/GlpR family DNA-binding transcription regulator [Corynebacterium suranareeae]BAU94466.1 DeoR family sugar metabolism transcriptional regulator [Corynebacterium suranareeae]
MAQVIPASSQEKRRERIVSFVTRHGSARVEALAELFDVSAMTIHRDLEALAGDSLVERIRGGARSVSPSMSELAVGQRRHLHRTVKDALCMAAARLIPEGAVVAIDDSTTLESLVAQLPERAPSALITHSLKTMADHRTRAGMSDIRLIACAGLYFAETDSFLGKATSAQLNELSADFSFVSTTAIRATGEVPALFHPDMEAADTKRALIGIGSVRVLVVDSSKFGSAGVFKVAPIDEFDHIIIDSQCTPEQRELLRNSRAHIHVVDQKGFEISQAPTEEDF